MKTMIVGGTGFIGRHLAGKLTDPIIAGRSLKKINQLFGTIEARIWNPSSPVDSSLFDGIDTVVNLAGESIFKGRWNKAKKERIRLSRIEGTRRIVDAIAASETKPKTLINSSAVGYYGSRNGEKLTEQSAAGNDFLAGVCKDWENEALLAKNHGVRVVLIRTGVVLGSDGGALSKMVPPFKLGLGGRLGSGKQFMPWIHIDDLINIILYAIDHPEVEGPVNAVAPSPLVNSEFTRALAATLRRPAIFPVPGFVLRLALGEFATVLLGSQRALPETIQHAGYQFDFPEINEALENLT